MSIHVARCSLSPEIDIYTLGKFLWEILIFKFCHVVIHDHILVYQNVNLINMTLKKLLSSHEAMKSAISYSFYFS